MTLSRDITLAQGLVYPRLFFSTPSLHFPHGDQKLVDAVVNALSVGFRGITTSSKYAVEVGKGIRGWGGKRQDLIIAVAWDMSGDPRGYLLDVLDKMKLDSIDDFQIAYHDKGEIPLGQLWRTFEEIKQNGLALSISIRDFPPEQLAELSKGWVIKPLQHHVEHHPYCAHLPLLTESRSLGDELDLPTGGYSTLVSVYTYKDGPIDPVVKAISVKKGLSDAQAILLWAVQTSSGTVSASTPDVEVMKEFLAIFEFEPLSPDEVDSIAQAGTRLEYKRF